MQNFNCSGVPVGIKIFSCKKNLVASPAPHLFPSPLIFLSTTVALSFSSALQEQRKKR